jgi:hypothetical protein
MNVTTACLFGAVLPAVYRSVTRTVTTVTTVAATANAPSHAGHHLPAAPEGPGGALSNILNVRPAFFHK